MKVCILSFSGRSGGNCGNIAALLRQWHEGNEVTVYDFSTFSVAPCGNCDCECFRAREACPYFDDPVVSIYDAVIHSDLTYFVIPNYCDYPCANFFAFNERSQCCFQGAPELLEQYLAVKKKFVVVSNTGRENFTAAFRYHVPEDRLPQVLFLSAKLFQKSSIKGDLMTSAEARQALLDFAGTDNPDR